MHGSGGDGRLIAIGAFVNFRAAACVRWRCARRHHADPVNARTTPRQLQVVPAAALAAECQVGLEPVVAARCTGSGGDPPADSVTS
jgi:hypothetical protein